MQQKRRLTSENVTGHYPGVLADRLNYWLTLTTSAGGYVELTPNQLREVADAVGWDDRKALADVFQEHCPLPAGDVLSERFYEAILACARYGAEAVAFVTVDNPDA